MKYSLYYLFAISVISVVITCYDKFASKKLQKHRTPEAALLFLSAFGGSVAMFVTMLLIRHKTQHKKFMIGIPLIMLAQAALIIYLYKNNYWS